MELAYRALLEKVGKDGKIHVIGASCGGGESLTLAESKDIDAIGFFSSAQRDENIERFQASLADKPTLIIAAEEDGRTYTSANALFKASKNANSKLIIYKGRDHGFPLLDKDANLAELIAQWYSDLL